MKILNYKNFLNEAKKEPVVHIHMNSGQRKNQSHTDTWCGQYSLPETAKIVSEKNHEKATCKTCIKLFNDAKKK